MTKKSIPILLVATLVSTLISPLAQAADAKVKIDNFTLSPPTLKAGATVTWTNEDDSPHTATSTTKAFKSQALDTNQSFSFTFTTPGAYTYFCALHPHMTGTIVVEAATGSNDSR
ncbi:MAG TPA: cupredoxin family copper-binding protein [Xanthobacteraceae bacterium]|nr:cupredoxin family copper-binding protein [Xanthobacteraceae bacterium]